MYRIVLLFATDGYQVEHHYGSKAYIQADRLGTLEHRMFKCALLFFY